MIRFAWRLIEALAEGISCVLVPGRASRLSGEKPAVSCIAKTIGPASLLIVCSRISGGNTRALAYFRDDVMNANRSIGFKMICFGSFIVFLSDASIGEVLRLPNDTRN